jgi:hypothetical protein
VSSTPERMKTKYINIEQVGECFHNLAYINNGFYMRKRDKEYINCDCEGLLTEIPLRERSK